MEAPYERIVCDINRAITALVCCGPVNGADHTAYCLGAFTINTHDLPPIISILSRINKYTFAIYIDGVPVTPSDSESHLSRKQGDWTGHGYIGVLVWSHTESDSDRNKTFFVKHAVPYVCFHYNE